MSYTWRVLDRRAMVPIVLLAALAAAQDDGFRTLIEDGVRHYQENRTDEALQRFARARQLRPSDWRGHAWQALTLLRAATAERDPVRRAALAGEAKTLSAQLIKNARLSMRDPLYNYVLGIGSSLQGDARTSAIQLGRAYQAPEAQFEPYAEIGLRTLVGRSYGRAAMDAARNRILAGGFADAEPLLKLAGEALPADDVGRAMLDRHWAVVDEALGRHEAAIARLRRCVEHARDHPDAQAEFRGTIALVFLKDKAVDEARAELAKVPDGNRNVEVVAARCALARFAALRDPRGPAMDEALALYRASFADVPEAETYRFVEEFAELVLARVGPAELAAERALIDEARTRLEQEIERKPECPGLYFKLGKIHALLGDAEKADELKRLHEQKKERYEKELRHDARGRPACG